MYTLKELLEDAKLESYIVDLANKIANIKKIIKIIETKNCYFKLSLDLKQYDFNNVYIDNKFYFINTKIKPEFNTELLLTFFKKELDNINIELSKLEFIKSQIYQIII